MKDVIKTMEGGGRLGGGVAQDLQTVGEGGKDALVFAGGSRLFSCPLLSFKKYNYCYRN